MSLYLLVMRGRDGVPDEVRYHDRPLNIGQAVDIDGKLWIVAESEDTTGRLQDPSGASITTRYVCQRQQRTSPAVRRTPNKRTAGYPSPGPFDKWE